MKYKTLFRLMLKAIGVWIVAQGIHQIFPAIAYILLMTAQGGGPRIARVEWYSVLGAVGAVLYTLLGLYLFFGGQWVVDKAIPSNRPYCHECGYDLTGTSRNRCPECDTPFRPEDVRPGTRSGDIAGAFAGDDRDHVA